MLQGGPQSILSGANFPKGEIISPDGRFAVLDETPNDAEKKWADFGAAEVRTEWRSASCRIVDGQSNRCRVRQLFLVDLATGGSSPLFDAPLFLGDVKYVSWSPAAKWLLLGPTYLPKSDRSEATKGWVIVDLQSRKVTSIQLPTNIGKAVSIGWAGESAFTFSVPGDEQIVASLHDGQWALRRTQVPFVQDTSIAVNESLNQPPKLQFTGRDGRIVDLFDPNPKLAFLDLAKAEMFVWTDSSGERWEGRLYLPPKRGSGPWPLVVQTQGPAKAGEFSIYGQSEASGGIGLGPGWSVYLAQTLATHGVAVLQVGAPARKPEGSTPGSSELDKLDRSLLGIVAAVEKLSGQKLVDPSRVGIMGHSASGRLVEHAITRGDFLFAAAIVADAADLNYLQHAMYSYGRPRDYGNIADPLSAAEMVKWISRSPALNADRVQTPVQFQVEASSEGSTTLMWHWEMYSALRSYGKAVEYFVTPDIQRGSHLLQNPRQLMVIQNRALDWWLFWLKGEEDPNPAKRGQYESWERMRPLALKARRETRRPLFDWLYSPK